MVNSRARESARVEESLSRRGCKVVYLPTVQSLLTLISYVRCARELSSCHYVYEYKRHAVTYQF